MAKAEPAYRSLVEEILPSPSWLLSTKESTNSTSVRKSSTCSDSRRSNGWKILCFWIGNCTRKIANAGISNLPGLATAQPFRSVYRFIARDGRVVWVLGEAKVVRDKDGRPLFLQGVAFDITERKNAEEELKLLNQTLGQRVGEAHRGNWIARTKTWNGLAILSATS